MVITTFDADGDSAHVISAMQKKKKVEFLVGPGIPHFSSSVSLYDQSLLVTHTLTDLSQQQGDL